MELDLFIFSITDSTSCSQGKMRSPRTLFEAGNVAGSATRKQSEAVSVVLSDQSVHSVYSDETEDGSFISA